MVLDVSVKGTQRPILHGSMGVEKLRGQTCHDVYAIHAGSQRMSSFELGRNMQNMAGAARTLGLTPHQSQKTSSPSPIKAGGLRGWIYQHTEYHTHYRDT